MPKISVIMGVYNCNNKEMLKKSVKSIIQQTFTDWEFIICNDGSTNDTLSMLKEIERMDKRIRIISYNENHGLAYALNKCIENSRGEFIARQDDDDISLQTRFEKQLKFLEENSGYGFVGSSAYVFDHNGVYGKYSVEEKPDKKSFYWNSPFIHPTVIFRKDALEKSGGYRVTKVTRRCEDYDLFMRLYAMGYKGYNIQEKLFYYQIVNGNKKYRPLKYRVDEMRIRWFGYRKMKVMSPKGLLYVVKPIIISLIPQFIFKKIRKKQFS